MPRVINKDAKVQIKKCFAHLKEMKPEAEQNELVSRLKDIFRVSERTIYYILKTDVENLETSPVGKRGKSDFWNYMFKKDLQRLIWRYNSNNEFYTVDKLLNDAKETLEFKGGRTTLYKILKSMGYKYKIVNGHKILCEQKHVLTAKINFLRKFLQYQKHENVTFIYLDETWIYQNGSNIRRWVHDSDRKSNPSTLKTDGKRFTILHSGCSLGFMDGCDYFLDSGNNDRDYHLTMNGDRFLNWVKEQLIPALSKLPGKLIVIMDNAPYHSIQENKPPNSSSTKQLMQEWLISRHIEFGVKLKKKELWQLIKPLRNNNGKNYVVDNLLRSYGHEVLRLPPYHCQYNPIEMVWGHCKTYYNKHINSKAKSRNKVQDLWLEALSTCTPAMWKKYCLHAEKLITEDWKIHMGGTTIEDIPPVIIALGESDSDSDLETALSESNCVSEIMDIPNEL